MELQVVAGIAGTSTPSPATTYCFVKSNINIKSFRSRFAFERVTFLCLCKEK